MTASPNPLSETLRRLKSLVGSVRHAVRHLRYRRAEMRRIPPADVTVDQRSDVQRLEWRDEVDVVGGRRLAVLECAVDSHVAYDVMMPPGACVTVQGAVVSSVDRRVPDVELTLSARVADAEVVARATPAVQRVLRDRGTRLSVSAPHAGAARVVLGARTKDGSPGDGLRVRWTDPLLEAPRSFASLGEAIRQGVAPLTVRGFLDRARPAEGDALYQRWVRETTRSARAWRAERRWAQTQTRTLTLMTVVADPATWRPGLTADSIRTQSYPGWEWIVVAASGSRASLIAALGGAAADPRIRILETIAADRAAGWNAALTEARGAFAAVIGPGDALAPEALYEMARGIERTADADVLYADEDQRSETDGRRHTPRFKPEWSPELLLASNYIGRLALFRTEAARRIGGFRSGRPGVEEWDLLLRLSLGTAKIRRVPFCLYHRSSADVPSDAGAASTLVDHYARLGLAASVAPAGTSWRATWPLARHPLVSIVIPNRDAATVLTQCVRGLREGTNYPHRELIIVDNQSTDAATLDVYRSVEQSGVGRIVPFDRPFNFSAACNAGAAASRGELLLFLNNDIEVIEADWLEELVRWACRPDVGIVGARLLYPDRTIQHAGVVFGLGFVGHIFSRAGEDVSGVFGTPASYRNYLAVTGACQMMRRSVFDQLGGYDERFRVSFSDVVISMEAWKAGYRVVYTPYARLVHHESYTRQRDDSPQDRMLLARYLEARGFVDDPYFHPELNSKASVPAIRPSYEPPPAQVVRQAIDRTLATADMGAR